MRKSLLFNLAALALLALPASALAAFAPADRQTFQCVTSTDCPGPNYVVFNSFINSPVADAPHQDSNSLGDERYFFEAKDASSTSVQTGFSDNVAIRDGQRILFRVYIHNDANPNLMGIEAAKARNTSVMVQLPSNNTNSAVAYISSTNARPLQISDTVDFSGSTGLSLTVDRSSINITTRTNNGDGDFATRPASGVEITDNNNFKVNLGDWDGGFKNHGSVTFIAVVHTDNAPAPVSASSLSCTGLDVAAVDQTKGRATVTARTNIQNANITAYSFTTSNSDGVVVDRTTVTTNAQTATYNFNQPTNGTYTVSAVVNTDKGNTAANNCTSQIVVNNQPVTATLSASTTAKPAPRATTTLPNTGAGDMLGIFTGASVLGTVGHYAIRRFRP